MNMNEGSFDMAPAVEREIERLEQIKAEIEEKAERLARNSRNQLEFLASMSHELLSPLETVLILAKRLADDDGNKLSPIQIDYAQTIYSAGTHLQTSINGILDLAKIEFGAATLNIEAERLTDLRNYFVRTFDPVAQDKDLTFEVELVPGLPATIYTDGKRLQQILDNLLWNAFKFTQQGGVKLRIAPAACDFMPAAARSDRADRWIELAVSDTGIGIPEGRQRSIVEFFDQGESAVHREDGGIGMGLSICRAVTRLLDGEIRASSKPGMGSCFTLYLPLSEDWVVADERVPPLPEASPVPAGKWRDVAHDTTKTPLMPVGQSRPYRGPKSRRSDNGVVLIVEGDARIASFMLDLVRSSGYEGTVAADPGKLPDLIGKVAPDAVLLGMNLCDSDDWAAFDLIKSDPETQRVPVSMICLNESCHKTLQVGGQFSGDGGANELAIMATTPQTVLARLSAVAGRAIRKLLVVDAAESMRPDSGAAWRINGAEPVVLGAGAPVVDALRDGNFDGVVLSAAPEDMSVGDLLKRIMTADLPADLPIAMVDRIGEADGGWAGIAILKRHSEFQDVLLETKSFLQRTVGHRPAARQEIPSSRRVHALELAGKKALIVDDIRNIYAITGMLEQQGMIVLHAESGAEGIEALCGNPDIDVVLVDTTVAELDSHGLIDDIRAIGDFKSLPIIAVTDKATPGNRWEYIGAGASDTIDKPVNVEQLLSLLRVWLVRG